MDLMARTHLFRVEHDGEKLVLHAATVTKTTPRTAFTIPSTATWEMVRIKCDPVETVADSFSADFGWTEAAAVALYARKVALKLAALRDQAAAHKQELEDSLDFLRSLDK